MSQKIEVCVLTSVHSLVIMHGKIKGKQIMCQVNTPLSMVTYITNVSLLTNGASDC